MRVQRTPLDRATILNVNVPDLPYEQLKGYQATRLGFRHRAEPMVKASDPRGRPVYWIGAAGKDADSGPGTDFHAVANGYVSVTPLQIDLTRHSALDDVRDWLAGRGA
jgi:5'-nucleotidase